MASALFVRTFVVDLWDYDAGDLAPLVLAAQVLADGESAHLYDHDPARFNRLESDAYASAAGKVGYRGALRPFVMPPIVAVACRAVSWMPFHALGKALLIANVLALALALFLLDRRLALGLRAPGIAALVVLGLYVFEPVCASLQLGQTTPLVFLMIVGVLALDRAGRSASAGVLLATAALIKVAPALLAFAWIVRRDRRALAAFGIALAVAAAASVILAGPSANVAFLERLSQMGRQSFPAFNNQSLAAVWLRFDVPWNETLDWRIYRLAPAQVIASYALLAGGLASAWLLWRRASAAMRDDCLDALLVLLMLAVPTVSWNHYYLYALVPAAVAWKHRPRAAGIAHAALVVAALALMCRLVGLGCSRTIHGNLFMSAYFVSALLLAAAVVSAVLAERAARSAV